MRLQNHSVKHEAHLFTNQYIFTLIIVKIYPLNTNSTSIFSYLKCSGKAFWYGYTNDSNR